MRIDGYVVSDWEKEFKEDGSIIVVNIKKFGSDIPIVILKAEEWEEIAGSLAFDTHSDSFIKPRRGK